VGDSASLVRESSVREASGLGGEGTLTIEQSGGRVEYPASLHANGRLVLQDEGRPPLRGPLLSGSLTIGEITQPVVARAVKVDGDSDHLVWQIATAAVSSKKIRLSDKMPSAGCMKMQSSMGQQRPAFPIHVQPTELESESDGRRTLSYQQAIKSLADLLLEHRPPNGRTLIYACGQIDYFTIFAFQEVFRLLGIRNLTGNAEHCLNAGAVHNEILTGQEGPFLTLESALQGPSLLSVQRLERSGVASAGVRTNDEVPGIRRLPGRDRRDGICSGLREKIRRGEAVTGQVGFGPATGTRGGSRDPDPFS